MRKYFRLTFCLCIDWIVLVVFSLSDLQIGRKLFISVVNYDYTVE